MQINCENMIVTSNKDGTYKLNLLNVPFVDSNGEEIIGMIEFPRVSRDGVNSFKNENMMPNSEIYTVIVPDERVQLNPLTLEFIKEKYCINCQQWHGESHDYKHKSCERCMENIKTSQKAFQYR